MKPIRLNKLPIRPLKWEALLRKVGRAHFILGKFEEILKGVEAPEKIFSILLKEEVLSSLRSQHISVGLKKYEEERAAGKRSRDLERIDDYARALAYGAREIKKGPITLALIRKLHALLSEGSGMRTAFIGHFRKIQNWIGPVGCTMAEAYMIPPKASHVPTLMKNLVDYLRTPEKEKLVQLAIFFGQLLNIHPFMDGNGRLGRILLPLFLFRAKLLSSPLFFFSRFLYGRRVHYFQKLNEIFLDDDWEGWIDFFLTSVIEQGEENCKKAERIRALYEKVRTLNPSKKQMRAIRFLFEHPIFEEKELGSRALLHKLAKNGLIRKKEKRWICPPLFNAVRKK